MADPGARLMQIQALLDQGRGEQARATARRLLQRDPGDADVNNAMAVVLASLGERAQASFFAERAVATAPAHCGALTTLGTLRALEGRGEEAEALFRRAVAADPRDTDARRGLCNVCLDRNRAAECVALARDGLERAPAHPDLSMCLAAGLLAMARGDEAIAVLRDARARHPLHANLADAAAFTANYVPGIDPAEVLAIHAAYGEILSRGAPTPQRTFPNSKDPERPLRIGLVSPDFRAHSVAFFIEPILAHADGAAFDFVIYMTSPHEDFMTRRLRAHVATWRNAANLAPRDLAARILADRIDILVDLSGHTRGHHLHTMHLRPAPVQATFLGYPNTTGLRAVGHRIADAITDPPGAEARGVENLVRLPGCFLCYNPPPEAPDSAPLTDDAARTFACFNAITKLNTPLLRAWGDLLTRAPGSRLVIKSVSFNDASVRDDLLARLAALGVPPDRLDLRLGNAALRDHLAEYHRVGVGLDPFPYHGTTTTCEALWMGVPVVTLEGRAHAARVGVSLLRTLGLDALIAQTPEGYARLAAELLADRPRLISLRATLRERLRGSTLCDQDAYARRFEAALRAMWRAFVAS